MEGGEGVFVCVYTFLNNLVIYSVNDWNFFSYFWGCLFIYFYLYLIFKLVYFTVSDL
ncbi:unnamed protein product [Meloidogyne enterolobii]|uniref:Uncharacterized protein n=1 Tax=Meloidogyne enterolobii TaxID=390850 RepID=A0ACB0XPX9_MELEN